MTCTFDASLLVATKDAFATDEDGAVAVLTVIRQRVGLANNSELRAKHIVRRKLDTQEAASVFLDELCLLNNGASAFDDEAGHHPAVTGLELEDFTAVVDGSDRNMEAVVDQLMDLYEWCVEESRPAQKATSLHPIETELLDMLSSAAGSGSTSGDVFSAPSERRVGFKNGVAKALLARLHALVPPSPLTEHHPSESALRAAGAMLRYQRADGTPAIHPYAQTPFWKFTGGRGEGSQLIAEKTAFTTASAATISASFLLFLDSLFALTLECKHTDTGLTFTKDPAKYVALRAGLSRLSALASAAQLRTALPLLQDELSDKCADTYANFDLVWDTGASTVADEVKRARRDAAEGRTAKAAKVDTPKAAGAPAAAGSSSNAPSQGAIPMHGYPSKRQYLKAMKEAEKQHKAYYGMPPPAPAAPPRAAAAPQPALVPPPPAPAPPAVHALTPRPPPGPPPSAARPRPPCYDFLRGTCTRGAACKFAH